MDSENHDSMSYLKSFTEVANKEAAEYGEEVAKHVGERALKVFDGGKLVELYTKEQIDGEAPLIDDNNPIETIRNLPLNPNMPFQEAVNDWMFRTFTIAGTGYLELEKEKTMAKLGMEIAKEDFRKAHPHAVTDSTEYSRNFERRLENINGQITELAELTPESRVAVRGIELLEHIDELNSGWIVTTPTVKADRDELIQNMKGGNPTLLEGDTGTGKTELAVMAAQQTMIEMAARKSAEKALEELQTSNPDATPQERLKLYAEKYTSTSKELLSALKKGDGYAKEKFSPILISGSKDLSTQDLYTDKTLKLNVFNSDTMAEGQKAIEEEMKKWRQRRLEENPEKIITKEEEQIASERILQLYINDHHSAFGTEVETIKQGILLGVEQGRPVIVDEVNAIPAAILISMNDILTKRPGEVCNVPGGGSVPIAEGFSLTMTGNISNNNTDYIGTGELNPAFIDRLQVIHHGYLPMSKEGSINEKDNSEKNELFYVMIASLCDEKGHLELPSPGEEEVLRKLFKLAQYARDVQSIFSGKNDETKVKTDSGDEITPEFKTTTLSMRGVLKILNQWNRETTDLDKALWDGYIKHIVDSDDRNFALSIAKMHGFFNSSDGWNVKTEERGKPAPYTLDEIRTKEYERRLTENTKIYDLRGVVEILYGKKEYDFAPEMGSEDEMLDEILVNDIPEIEDYNKTKEILVESGVTLDALEVLGAQCGCNVGEGE